MGRVTARPLGLHVRGLVGFVVRLRAAGEAGIACGAGGAAGVPLLRPGAAAAEGASDAGVVGRRSYGVVRLRPEGGGSLYTGVVYQCASDLYSSSRAKFASDGGCRVPISSSG